MNFITLLESPIAFHRVYARIGGGAAAGVFISQLVYWHQQMKKAKGPKWDGWFYKTAAEWERETCTTRRERETAEKALTKLEIIEITLRQIPAKKHYRLNEQVLNEAVSQFVTSDNSPQPSKSASLPDMTNKIATSDNLDCHIEQSSLSDVTSQFATSDKLDCHIEQSITENTQRLPENKTDTCASGEPKCAGGEKIDSEEGEKPEPWISESGVELTGKVLEVFSTLWNEYDYKHSRARAIDAFIKIIMPMFGPDPVQNRSTLDTLVGSIKSHVAARTSSKKVLHFENWITGRRWEDATPIKSASTPRKPNYLIPRWQAKGFSSEEDCAKFDELAGYYRNLERLQNRTPHQESELQATLRKLDELKPKRVAA